MLFNSFSFLGFFSVLAVACYSVSHRFRWALLLAASLYFYAAFQPRYLILLLGAALVTYVAGRLIERLGDDSRRRAVFTAGVAAVLGCLLVFKYYDFAASTLDELFASTGAGSRLPLFPRLDLAVAVGLSFFTFSCVSYLADVHAKRLPAERHFGHFALYVSFFPKLLAGPVERAGPFLPQLVRPVAFDAAGVTAGLEQMLWGLFKKVVVADRLAAFVDAAYAQPAFSSPADLVLGTYFFAFQLYCDFSGYSDMAIGASKVLGIDLMENFRRPYLSASVPEFWSKRWHLSLAGWFRDYLYIPMGGSRCSRPRRHFNVMAVFLVSGLWHGANWTFVVWGCLNGLYQVFSLVTRRARARIGGLADRVNLPSGVRELGGVLVTFHLVLVTWVFFRAESLTDAVTILSRVTASAAELPRLLLVRIANGEILFSFALIAVLLLWEVIDERRPVWDRLTASPVYVRWAVYYALLVCLVVLGTWSQREFVYMQF